MKRLFFALVTLMAIATTAVAQEFSYQSNSCRYTQLRPVDKAEWIETSLGFVPKEGLDPLLYEKSALCQGLYGRIEAGVATSGALTMPEVGVGLGYQFNFKHHGPVGAKVEGIVGLSHSNKVNYRNLAEIQDGIGYRFGGQAALDFFKHSTWGFSLYCGGGVQFINSKYAAKTLEQTDGKFLKEAYHGTSYYEAGARVNYNAFGITYSLGGGVKVLNTKQVSYTCGVVTLSVQFNKVKKSSPVKYSEFIQNY